MANEFKLPQLGEGVESGEVVEVLVSEGDTIEVDQPVLELEMDKATVEVPSGVSGVVQKIHVQEGDTAEVGQVILTVGEEGEGDEEAAAPQADKEEEGEQETEGAEKEKPAEKERGKPAKKPEKTKKESEEEDEKEEEEAAAEATKADKGKTKKKAEGKPRKGREEEEASREETSAGRPAPVEERPAMPGVPAAPSTRKFAREIGVDISRVPGSGPQGRVSVEDVKAYSRQMHERRERTPAAGAEAPPELPDFERWGEVRRERMSTIRRRTAEHMIQSWSHVPHVTQFDVADITELDALRKRYAPKAEKAGGKLTVTTMLVKIVSAALNVFPKFAASIDMQAKEVVYKDYCNIGLAVDTERGLMVPVIKDVRQKNMIDISVDMVALAEKTRSGRIRPDELQGSVFTITNLGSIGGTHFTPIVNLPEAAILGMGRAYRQPGFGESGVCEPRFILPLSLSYDHRLIDGAEGARFLRWIVDAIEEPLLLSLEG